MRWRTRPPYDYIDRRVVWHRWFAWYPVRVGGTAVWLEWVGRKGTMRRRRATSAAIYWTWEYRFPTSRLVNCGFGGTDCVREY